MIQLREEKPIHPKNGDIYSNKQKEVFEFRYGIWIKLGGGEEKEDDTKS